MHLTPATAGKKAARSFLVLLLALVKRYQHKPHDQLQVDNTVLLRTKMNG